MAPAWSGPRPDGVEHLYRFCLGETTGPFDRTHPHRQYPNHGQHGEWEWQTNHHIKMDCGHFKHCAEMYFFEDRLPGTFPVHIWLRWYPTWTGIMIPDLGEKWMEKRWNPRALARLPSAPLARLLGSRWHSSPS